MAGELWRAVCLVAVLEGLVLFVSPHGWKRAAERLRSLPDPHLRAVGAIVVTMALTALWCLRVG
ncbi:hypothetical protein A7A76_21905 [Lysobacter enzymogenes]|uniref:DUF2065 domain-containing protein n=1 Tax=Lysobacter enzymogenes TaxID=69 RepID=UPI0019D16722|nr:DUF2065 family protein [Lysobacter enzymogenes]MBN7137376.1 hypothetical protein [Lysobacter enzymogenes]